MNSLDESKKNESDSLSELAESLPEWKKKFKPYTKKPLPGFAYNPLRTLPRNLLCPCLSGKKFKVCHLRLLPEIIPEKLANEYAEKMKRPKLIFKTSENTDAVIGPAMVEKKPDAEGNGRASPDQRIDE